MNRKFALCLTRFELTRVMVFPIITGVVLLVTSVSVIGTRLDSDEAKDKEQNEHLHRAGTPEISNRCVKSDCVV